MLETFEDRLRFGEYGESIILEYLLDNNETVFTHPSYSSAPIDFITVSTNGKIEMVEIKTKQVKNGAFTLSSANTETYTALVFNNGLPLNIYLVDFTNGKLYKSRFKDLLTTNESTGVKLPKFYSTYTAYPVANMEFIRSLSDEHIKRLEELRN